MVVSSGTKDKSYHAPLSIPAKVEEMWKSDVPEPFLSILMKLRKSVDFRSQTKIMKDLTSSIQSRSSSLSKETFQKLTDDLIRSILSIIEHESMQEKPTHVPTEFFHILKRLFSSLDSDSCNQTLESFLNHIIHQEECLYSNLHMLDLLLLHNLWTISDISSNGALYYSKILNECSGVIFQLASEIIDATNEQEQSFVIIKNSLKIENSLQVLLRMASFYQEELKKEILDAVNEFRNGNKHTTCKLVNAILMVLRLDQLQQESTTPAGLLLCQFLVYIEDADFLLEQIFACFFPSELPTKVYSLLEFFWNSDIPFLSFEDYPIQSKLAIYRGLSIAMPGEILTKSFMNQENNDGTSKVLLFSSILPAILSISTTITVPLRKLVAFQSVKNACFKISSLLNLSTEQIDEIGTNSICKTILGVSHSLLFSSFYPELIDVFWRTWEYHHEPVVQQINLSFDSLIETQQKILSFTKNEEEKNEANRFMEKIIKDVSSTEWNKRGKYAIFTSVSRTIGTISIVKIAPNFFEELFEMFIDSRLSSKAAHLLSNLLYNWNGYQSLSDKDKKKFQNSKKLKQSGIVPIDTFLPIFIEKLCSCSTTLQYGLITYAIPIILQVYPNELVRLLEEVTNPKNTNNHLETKHMIPVLSIIKHCKKQGILNPADLEKLMETNTSIPIRQIFKIGITSGDFMLRQTTLGSLCETRSLSEKLTNFEEDLLKTFLRYCIRDSLGPQGKHEIGALLQKLMVRYKSNLRQQVSTLSYQDSSKLPELYDEFLNFINESCNQIGVCFYPGCPSSKMFLAIYLYNQLFLDIWSYDTIDEIPVKTKRKPDRTGVNPKDFIPMETLSKLSIYESHNLESLFSCIWDSFEKTRELVFDTIRKFPSPLPNIPFDKFRYYLDSAKALICSSRARNGDTGALIIRIVCSQYLQNSSITCDDSFYVIEDKPTSEIQNSLQLSFNISNGGPVIRLFSELLYLLTHKIKAAESDKEISEPHREMQGILVTIRYLILDLHSSFKSSKEQILFWRELIAYLMKELLAILTLAMNVIADLTTEGWTPSLNMDKNNDSNYTVESDGYVDNGDDDDVFTQGRQVVVASWLLIKSVSLLLGTLIQQLPIERNNNDNLYILTINQVKESAEGLLKVLLSTRHKGVLEKTYIGFEMICQSIFASQIPDLLSLTNNWLDILYYNITHITTSIITRRSAGIPFSMCAILRAEVKQSHSVHIFLNQVMEFLLNQIKTTSDTSIESISQEKELCIVHSFNVLRCIVTDKILGSHVDTWIASFFEYTIEALSNPSWAIRNAASLSFAVLITRTLGVSKRDIEERSKTTCTTFSILFSRLTPMYPYLLKKFSTLLNDMKSSNSEESQKLFITQTSLYSLLILLSRLSPSDNILSNSIAFDSSPFVPLVLQCCEHSDYKVREMAARALVPLIPSNDVPSFLLSRLDLLPQQETIRYQLNQTHGILLQVLFILKENMNSLLSSDSLKEQIGQQIIPKISSLSWMLKDSCYSIAKVYGFILFLIESKLKSFNVEDNISNEISRNSILDSRFVISRKDSVIWKPMRATLRELVTEFCCDKALSNTVEYQNITKESSSQLFISLLFDEDYEVRSKSLDILGKYLIEDNNLSLEWNDIQSAALDRILIETNEEVSAGIYKLLFRLPIPLPSEILNESSNHWKNILRIIQAPVVSSLVHQNIIEYLGYFISQMDSLENNCIVFWLSQLDDFVKPSQPMEFRYSVLKSIIASKILENTNIKSKETVVRCWILASILLEDDDCDIRNEIVKYLSLNTSLSSYSPTIMEESEKNQNNCIIEITLSPSLAKESIFEMLSHCYYDNSWYQHYLYKKVCLNILSEPLPDWESNNNELFTKELDNMFEEPLFQSHIYSISFYNLLKQNRLSHISIPSSILLNSLEKLYEIAESFNNSKDETMIILPFADKTRFLYLHRLVLSLFCLTSNLQLENNEETENIKLLFSKSMNVLSNAKLPSTIIHSLYFVFDVFNERILKNNSLSNPFQSIFGINIFFSTSINETKSF